jgi:histidine triad (HIT) family protein
VTGCVFYRILTGDFDGSFAYEDDVCAVIMDLMPVNDGHALVLPRRHAELVGDLDARTRAHVFEVATDAGRALRRGAFRCEGLNVWLADGEAAGQEVPHVHVHVLPRHAGDGFGLLREGGWAAPQPRATLDDAAARLRTAWP